MLARLALLLAVSFALGGALAGPLAAEDPPAPPAPAPGIAGPAPVTHAGPSGRVALGPEWVFKPDPGNRGLAGQWRKLAFQGNPVEVPYSPNAWPVTGAKGYRNFRGSVGWYRTSFTVPETGRYALRFESVNHRAAVWLNGQLIGKHIGTYLPFELRPQLVAGKRNLLVVRADWRDPVPGMKRGGWHRGWFNYGGINREVTLRRLQASEIEAPIIQASPGTTSAFVSVSMRVHNRGGTREIAPTGVLSREGVEHRLEFPAQVVKAGARVRFSARLRIRDAALWSPTSPALYEMQLFVPGEGGYQARVGLRRLTIEKGHVSLNGTPLFLYGASLHEDIRGHGDALTPADMDSLVNRLKSLGANATRAQHALSPALLERLDAAGVMVWQEVGPWDSPGNWLQKTPGLRRLGQQRIDVSFEQLQLHPSIFAWNLGNEVGGQGHVESGQDVFIDNAARRLKKLDPGRLTAVDVWGILLPRRNSRLYSHIDAIGTTSYFGWYEAPFAKPAAIQKLIRGRVAFLRRIFPSKAIVASEFGAEGNRLNASNVHGGLNYQARLLKLTLDTYAHMPEATGMLVWNLQDFGVNPTFGGGSILRKVRGIKLVPGLNQKGIFDSLGKPKPAAAVVTQAFKRARAARG